MGASPRVAMVAGETSGDLLAGLLLDGIQAQWPGLQAQGIGGPQMARRGFTAWWPSERLAVHGYSMEVLRRLRDILGIRKQLRARLLQDRPDVFIGVDAPDFNLGLEADLRAAGIKTVHFVCPSIWAWRADRVEKIRRSADHVLCIFPFEPALLAQHGIAATYVGHPLANVIPMVPDRRAARAQLGLHDGDEVLAILPGSRSAEVEYIASPFFQAAALVLKARPAIKMIVPAVPALRGRIRQLAQASGLVADLFALSQALFVEANPIPVKHLAARMGLCQPAWRLPLVPPGPATAQALDRLREQSRWLAQAERDALAMLTTA